LTNKAAGDKALDIYDNIDADDVEVSIDGKTVKATVSINKDEEMTIALKDSLELAAKEQVQIIVSAKFNSDFEDYGTYVQLAMDKASDISATDKNNARITVNLAGATGKWVKYTINGGQVKLTNTKLGNVDAALNSTDVLVAE
jgi:CO dehydrogenase/acetyl-CoA synthase delta subunit